MGPYSHIFCPRLSDIEISAKLYMESKFSLDNRFCLASVRQMAFLGKTV